jgi:hypothetical protein
MEELVANLGFALYLSLLCIWWYRAVGEGEFDVALFSWDDFRPNR